MKAKFAKFLKLLPRIVASFFAIYLAAYFLVMRTDTRFLFVWSNLENGPHYPPAFITGITIVLFAGVWLIVLVAATFAWFLRRRRGGRRAVGAQN